MEKNNNLRVPQHIHIDSISPATRLLEMRKDMYEEQEVFEKKKEAFKTSEDTFKRREQELRDKDLKIQESLLKFAKYLEDNEAKKEKAVGRKKEEMAEIQKKKVAIDELDQRYKELVKDSNRIERKVEAMRKYENFLKLVKEQNPDEFNELNDIVSRYNTLYESNRKLQEGLDKLNNNKEAINLEMANYVKEKKAQRMTITNGIGELQKQLEELESK